MKLTEVLAQTGILGSLIILLPIGASAFDLDLLKNDKEAVSRSYRQDELEPALNDVSGSSDQAFQALGAAFNELEASGTECGSELFALWKTRLEQQNIPLSMNTIHKWLVVWRSQSRIDDVFFEIMEQVSNLGFTLGLDPLSAPSDRELKRAQTLLDQNVLSDTKLKALYSPFKGSLRSHPGCSTNPWNTAYSQLGSIPTGKDGIRIINVAALKTGVLNMEEFNLVEGFRTQNIQAWRLSFENYFRILKEAKNKSRPLLPKPADLSPNPFSSSLQYLHSDLTYRKSLYSRFNATQINLISNLLYKTFNRMDATKAELIFVYQNGTETIPVSPMGQYYFARKLLEKDIQELNQSSIFAGSPFSYSDLVSAALETGLINAELLSSVFKIENLWNPAVKEWSKISNYALQVTGNATIFLPPPFNVISSVALVFIEGIIQKKNHKPSQADSGYDPF